MKKNGQGNAPKNGAGRTENPQERFLLAGVGVFLKHGELSQMTVQNDYGAILVKRAPDGETVTRAIGFNADWGADEDEDDEDGEEYGDDGDEEDEDEDDYNAVVSRFVRWLV